MKKNDIILLILCFGIGIIGILFLTLIKKDAGYVSVVTEDGKEEIYSLAITQEIVIESPNGGKNILLIRDGVVDMTEANCPNGDCVRQKEISSFNESIVCLPNKVVVRICNEEKNSDLDAVTY